MGRARLDQVNENIRRELSQLLHQEFEGAVATLLSVTRVEITPDLRLAKIFISALGSEKDINLLVKKLNRSLPFWQGVLAERIMMKLCHVCVFSPMIPCLKPAAYMILLTVLPPRRNINDSRNLLTYDVLSSRFSAGF